MSFQLLGYSSGAVQEFIASDDEENDDEISQSHVGGGTPLADKPKKWAKPKKRKRRVRVKPDRKK